METPTIWQLAKESGKIYNQQRIWLKMLIVNKKTGNCYVRMMIAGCDRKQRVSNCMIAKIQIQKLLQSL